MIRFVPLTAAFHFGLAVAAGLFAPPASAAPISVTENTVPFVSTGFGRLRLGAAQIGSIAPYTAGNDTVSFTGIGGDEGFVKGSSPGNYAPPVTDSSGDVFAGKYLSVGNTGDIDIAFARPQRAISLLWGSIDDSNEITLLNGSTIVGVVDGADIDATANGLQGVGGSLYVLIQSAIRFTDIEISSGVQSFEIADLRTSPREVPVHEPASITLLAAGLVGVAGIKRIKDTQGSGSFLKKRTKQRLLL